MNTALPKHRRWCRIFHQVGWATLASGLSEAMEYAVGARVLEGNGLTVIADIGDPAGQTILARSFPSGIVPLGLPGSGRWLWQPLIW